MTIFFLNRPADVAGGRGQPLHGRGVHVVIVLFDLFLLLQVCLCGHEDNRHLGQVVRHLGLPPHVDVLHRRRRVHGEAEEDQVRVEVGERPETVVVFVARGVGHG